MDTKKFVCYANINSFNSPEGITDQHMRDFFANYLEGRAADIIDVVVDRCDGACPLARREGWKKVQELCRAQHIDSIVVPTIHMLEPAVVSLVGLNKEFNNKYGTGFVFLLEEIAEAGENLSLAIQIQTMFMDNRERAKETAANMHKVFYEATGIGENASAIPVDVDCALYQKAKEKASAYGDDVNTLVRHLLEFAVDSANEQSVDKYIYGVEPEGE